MQYTNIIQDSDFNQLLLKANSINGDDINDLGFTAEYKKFYLMFGGNETTIEVEELVKKVGNECLPVEFNSSHIDKMYDVIVGKLKEIEINSLIEELDIVRPDTLYNEIY